MVTISELAMVMRGLGHDPSAAELKAMVGQVDADGNYTITFPEFLKRMEAKVQVR